MLDTYADTRERTIEHGGSDAELEDKHDDNDGDDGDDGEDDGTPSESANPTQLDDDDDMENATHAVQNMQTMICCGPAACDVWHIANWPTRRSGSLGVSNDGWALVLSSCFL